MKMHWIHKLLLLLCAVCLLAGLPAAAVCQTTPTDGDWSKKKVILKNTTEARLMVRVGDIDNLGFGWPEGFNPFSGNSTPGHGYPWAVNPEDPDGTDRIMVLTSYVGAPPCGQDGYTGSTSRPDNEVRSITLEFNPQGIQIRSAILQMFVDDFQAPVWCASYQVELDGVRAPFMEAIINSLVQTGPIGKLITVEIPVGYLNLLSDGILSITIDDPTTGAGDGYAIDFAKLLINPRALDQTGTIEGFVVDSASQQPIEKAIVSAAGVVEAKTDADGKYTLTDVPAGLVTVEAFKAGYERDAQVVDLIAGQTVGLNFSLNPTTTAADLSVTKVGTPDPAMVGENLIYTVTVSNRGPDEATNVVMIDGLPEDVLFVSAAAGQGSCSEIDNTVTCDLGAIANAASVTITIEVTPTAQGNIINVARVAGREKDPRASNNRAGITTAVIPSADCDLTGTWKSLTQTCKGANCSLDGVFLLKNQGKGDASRFVLKFLSSGRSNAVLKQMNISSLKAGETMNVPLSARVSTSAAGAYIIGVVDALNAVAETDEGNNVIDFGPIP